VADYVPTIDLTQCPLSNEEICEAVLAITGVEPLGKPRAMAFKFSQGGVVLLTELSSSFPMRVISINCTPGHPEEFGQLATAIAARAMSKSITGTRGSSGLVPGEPYSHEV